MIFKRGDIVINDDQNVLVEVDHYFADLDFFAGLVIDSRSETDPVGEWCAAYDPDVFKIYVGRKLPEQVKLIKNTMLTDLFWDEFKEPVDNYILDMLTGKYCGVEACYSPGSWPNHSRVRITIEELERLK